MATQSGLITSYGILINKKMGQILLPQSQVIDVQCKTISTTELHSTVLKWLTRHLVAFYNAKIVDVVG